MAKAVGVLVTGDKQIDRKLKRMPLALQKKISRKATRKAAKDIVLVEAKARVPRNTGKLAASLAVRAAKARRGRFGHQVETKPGQYTNEEGDQFPGAFLEFGTKERFHKPSTVLVDGEEQERGRKWVGRIEPRKFGYMRSALYDRETQIHGLYLQAMREFIAEAASSPSK